MNSATAASGSNTWSGRPPNWASSYPVKRGAKCPQNRDLKYPPGFFNICQPVASATDSAYTSGDVGLPASTFETPGAGINFDNFVVRQP